MGFPCGKSCISKLRKCWNNLPKDGANKQFETFSQFVNRIVGTGSEKESAIKTDSAVSTPDVPEFDINVNTLEGKFIGAGEFGKVFDFGDVVLKTGDISQNEKAVLQILTDKKFPHAPKLVGQSEDRLAMTKAPGYNQYQLSDQGIKNDDDDRQNILNAVKELHKAGVAHGDIHGGNIMTDKETNKVTFVDFGLGETKDISAYGEGQQTPRDFGYSMLRDAFNAQYLYGKSKNKPKSKLLEEISWMFIKSDDNRKPRDLKEAIYEIDIVDNTKVVKLLENHKKLATFLEDFYKI